MDYCARGEGGKKEEEQGAAAVGRSTGSKASQGGGWGRACEAGRTANATAVFNSCIKRSL